MFQRFKKRILPREHRPPMTPEERVLAWAMTSSDQAVVATNLGLWRDGERIPWSDISKAVWDGNVLTVTASRVAEARDGYSVIEDLPPERLVLVEPGHLPHQARLRVTGSVVRPQRFASGLIAARRVPGEDGLSWVVRYDPGISAADHVAEADAAFRETQMP